MHGKRAKERDAAKKRMVDAVLCSQMTEASKNGQYLPTGYSNSCSIVAIKTNFFVLLFICRRK